jgi:hypothetical protein
MSGFSGRMAVKQIGDESEKGEALKRDEIGLKRHRALGFLIEHDLRANAFSVCREGKPLHTLRIML